MADHQSEHFMPDKIDAQIDVSLGGEHTAQYPDPLDWQVILVNPTLCVTEPHASKADARHIHSGVS